MLLRNLLEDLNGMMSIPQAMFVLDDICIDKDGDDWNFAIDVRGNIENSSIMLRQGTFVTDTFIHKNYDVNFTIQRSTGWTADQPVLVVDAIQRIELCNKISYELNLN
jgi:hypothetical protein